MTVETIAKALGPAKENRRSHPGPAVFISRKGAVKGHERRSVMSSKSPFSGASPDASTNRLRHRSSQL